MPKTPNRTDALGIKWEGDVLQGKLTVTEALASTARSSKPPEPYDPWDQSFKNAIPGVWRHW